jgi:hypothetical protein
MAPSAQANFVAVSVILMTAALFGQVVKRVFTIPTEHFATAPATPVATQTLDQVLTQINTGVAPTTQTPTVPVPVVVATPPTPVVAKPQSAASSVKSSLLSRAVWVSYFTSRDFWFPNLFSIVWIATLLFSVITAMLRKK